MSAADRGAASCDGQVEQDQSVELIRRARSGEAEALHELIDSWRTYLLTIAESELDQRLQPKKGASDLVQSACLDIYEHFQEFRGETTAEWRSWLLQLLRRDIQDLRRRFRDTAKRDLNREQRIEEWDSLRFAPTDDDLSPGASLIAIEESTALRAALQSLSADHRQVIRLRNWEELSFAEIGRRLDRSEDSARKLWTRAMAKLQAELKRIQEEA